MNIDVEALKARTDIVALISSYVPDLKKRGNDWWACCPLHGPEKTPSFKVSPEGWFKCHACSVGGDCFTFLENIEHTDFKGALVKLQEFLGDTPTNGNGNGHKPKLAATAASGAVTPEWVQPPTPEYPNIPVPPDAPKCAFIHAGMPKPAIAWEYKTLEGEILGYDARYNKPDGTKDKVLPWRWIDGAWRMKGFATPTPLYGLEYINAFKDKPILMVEGCKDADAARKLFKESCIVVSWQGGVDSVKKVDLTPLHGRTVMLWPDADSLKKKEVGQKAMLYFANKLMHVCPDVSYFDPNPTGPCSACTQGVDDLGQPCPSCEGRGRVYLMDPMPDGWGAADALAEGWDPKKWSEWLTPRLKDIKVHLVETQIAKAKEDRQKTERKIKEGKVSNRAPMPYQALWLDWGLQTQGETCIPFASLDNVCRILDNDPMFQNFVYRDTFLQKTFNCHSNREWADADEVNLLLYMQRNMGIQKMSRNTIAEGIIATAYKDERNCVKEWLEGLAWDGEERLGELFPEYFGAGRTPYTAAVGRCFMVSMVARAYLPGCKADHMIVLEGAQGIRKSSALEALVGSSWFADTDESVTSKDFKEGIQGKWLIEIGEMGSFDRADRDAVKQMLSRRTDHYRGSYERYSADRPRQCIFAGTTNKDNWNKDETGARRFWPIRCRVINIQGLIAVREQLFAEAVAIFKRCDLNASEVERMAAGTDWWVTPGEETKREQEARYDDDPWTASIGEAIRSRFEITVTELLTDVLKIETGRQGAGEQRRVGAILRHMNWTKTVERPKEGGPTTNRIWRPRVDEYEL